MSYLIQSVTTMVHADIRALERYWQELRAGRSCPYRAEVDPRDIRSRIGNLFILEDLGLGNIRFRIAGTTLSDTFGIELRGMPLRSIMEVRARQSMTELLAETLAEPGVGYARLRRSGPRAEAWEIILLPLRSEQGRIDRLIGALHCLEPGEPQQGGISPGFTIEEMSITPVDVTASADSEVLRVQGFGDAPLADFAGQAHHPAPQTVLRAIEGGRACLGPTTLGVPDRGPRRNPRLRLVKDD